MTELDAYRRPRVIREGCQHNLGCRCEPPFWLRASTPAEEAHTEHMRPVVDLDYERMKGFAP